MDDQHTKTIRPASINVVIQGRMIEMKPFSEDELNERYLSWLNNPEINRFLEVRHRKQSIDDVIHYINDLRSKPGCELFAIFTKKEHIHIGNLSLTEYNPNNQGTAVYGLMIGDLRAQMLGLGGEASALIVEYLFRDPNIRRIHEGVIADNHRAYKTLEFLGFQREGVLRKHAVLPSGKISDVYIYGMLREEWISNRVRVAKLLENMRILGSDIYDT